MRALGPQHCPLMPVTAAPDQKACQSHPREHTLIYGDAVHSVIACARGPDLARANSMAEWCRAPFWKICLQGRCRRLDRCPFPADDACWRKHGKRAARSGLSIGLLHCSLKQQSRRRCAQPTASPCPHRCGAWAPAASMGIGPICQSNPHTVRPE